MARSTEALELLLAVLDRMEIPYEIGGSIASSLHGVPRTTLDVDIVVDLPAARIEEFTEMLGGSFYADSGLVRECFGQRRAANVIHIASGWKFDLFPLADDEYSRAEFARRAYRRIALGGSETVECAVASAEDVVLRKLQWYRAGGETSERQWTDLSGICRTNRLDTAYLSRWAAHLGLSDLLAKLTGETR